MSEEQTTKKSNGGYVLIILLLLLATAAMAYLWTSTKSTLSDCEAVSNEQQSQINEMNEMLSQYTGALSQDLSKDFRSMLDTYDALLEKDKSQADSINAQKAYIEELLVQVEKGKLNGYQLAKLRKENETLRDIMRGYVYQIDSLNTANYQLRSDLDQTTTALTQTTSERDQFKEVAETATAKVKEGSKLQAYSFTTVALRMKLNDMPTETSRANNAVQIKSSFTLGANPIADAGTKTVYMQITKPDGKIFQIRSSNVVDTDQGKIAYSDKKDIDYRNVALDMAIYYDLRGEQAQKGNYTVKIYCEGQLIGKDSFTLK